MQLFHVTYKPEDNDNVCVMTDSLKCLLEIEMFLDGVIGSLF